MTRTLDGLPMVSKETFMEFLREYDISNADNDPEVTRRIESENPQIFRLLNIGMKNAPNKEAKSYYKGSMQIVYELLRRESKKDKTSYL